MKHGPGRGWEIVVESASSISDVINAYSDRKPDAAEANERVAFGTSGHRGSSLLRTFNQQHILAICESIAEYRAARGYSGPLILGRDTHALSGPAFETAQRVFLANGVQLVVDEGSEFTPTPVVSHAILRANRATGPLADGVVITPSHNPPED